MERKAVVDATNAFTEELIVQQLSDQFKDLYAVRPQIIAEGSKKLCDNSPTNLIGSTILFQNRDQYLERFDRTSYKSPPKLISPIKIIHDVPLFVYSSEIRDYQDLSLTAETVYYKQCMGELSGVVTQGEYAGLLVTPVHPLMREDGMCISRIWNDSHTSYNSCLPYGFVRGFEDKSFREQQIASSIQNDVNVKYKMLVESYSAGSWTSDLFVDLCTQIGIPIDAEQFTSIRHPR